MYTPQYEHKNKDNEHEFKHKDTKSHVAADKMMPEPCMMCSFKLNTCKKEPVRHGMTYKKDK